jgi:hypothetical protein
MVKHLTEKMKMEYLPLLIKRDEGFLCFYCKQKLDHHTFVYDHLNNNREDNRIENIVTACQSCNNKKPHNYDHQIMASEKLEQNLKSNFMRAREFETETFTKEVSTEIDINTSNFEITEKFITERVATDGSVPFSDALHSCTYLCKSQTGHGSQQSLRYYISALTSSMGPFMIIKDERKQKIIVKRTDN